MGRHRRPARWERSRPWVGASTGLIACSGLLWLGALDVGTGATPVAPGTVVSAPVVSAQVIGAPGGRIDTEGADAPLSVEGLAARVVPSNRAASPSASPTPKATAAPTSRPHRRCRKVR